MALSKVSLLHHSRTFRSHSSSFFSRSQEDEWLFSSFHEKSSLKEFSSKARFDSVKAIVVANLQNGRSQECDVRRVRCCCCCYYQNSVKIECLGVRKLGREVHIRKEKNPLFGSIVLINILKYIKSPNP